MRTKESRAREKVWAAVDGVTFEAIDALVTQIPESMRERHDPTRPDVVRLLLARGLAWVEANGTEAIPEARTVTKRTTARRASR